MNKNKFVFSNFLIIFLGAQFVLALLAPWSMLFLPFWKSLQDFGTVGDAFNGLSAPFISLLSAFLIFWALREQRRANFLFQEFSLAESYRKDAQQIHEILGKIDDRYVVLDSIIERIHVPDLMRETYLREDELRNEIEVLAKHIRLLDDSYRDILLILHPINRLIIDRTKQIKPNTAIESVFNDYEHQIILNVCRALDRIIVYHKLNLIADFSDTILKLELPSNFPCLKSLSDRCFSIQQMIIKIESVYDKKYRQFEIDITSAEIEK
jgi:hypothetical protein